MSQKTVLATGKENQHEKNYSGNNLFYGFFGRLVTGPLVL